MREGCLGRKEQGCDDFGLAGLIQGGPDQLYVVGENGMLGMDWLCEGVTLTEIAACIMWK